MNPEDFTEMKVFRLVMDPNSNSPIVILHDEVSGVLLPIWIGLFEAQAIAMKLEGMTPPRPMTHDLLSDAIASINGLVNRVEVTDLVDSTYFARIYFQLDRKRFSLDSRPSDAIALALRSSTPIYVANHVLEQSKIEPEQLVEQGDSGSGDSESEEDKAERLLRSLHPPKDPRKLN